MTNGAKFYNIAAIRELLLAAFTPGELRRFCQDQPSFRPILADFGSKYSLNDMIYEVIVYCHANQLFDELLAEIEAANPRQYARFKEHLHTDDPHTYDAFVAEETERRTPPLSGLVRHITQTIAGGTEAQRALRNRQAMLQLVRNTWIKGVLEQSLHGAAMIELGMEERADAVERPWDVIVQMPGQPRRQLPHGTKLIHIFGEMNQSLLILGEPGSGKTTMLLELARDTIARAEQDPTRPIPVVFNLSSWAEKKLAIAEWLVEELNSKYHIPKKLADPWVENDELLLLLDGLDEVKVELRDACVQALNAFCQEHLVPVAVCSRIEEYEALTTNLKLNGAVLLQPLTPEQIDEYLEGAGTELLAVRQALRHDLALQEFVQTPLMLNIMTLAYQGVTVEDMGTFGSPKTRRQHLFDVYLQGMFKRRGTDQPYALERTVRWLAWLAERMIEHGQSEFLIERMQPSWLQKDGQQRMYTIGYRLLIGLGGGLVVALIGGLAWGLVGGLDWGLGIGLALGLCCALVLLLSVQPFIGTAESISWSWKALGIGPAFGLFVGLLGGLVGGLSFGPGVGLSLGLAFGLGAGLVTSLIAGLIGSIGTEVEVKTTPNQGIRSSARNAVIVGLAGGLAVGLILGLGAGLVRGFGIGPVGILGFRMTGLHAGLSVGLGAGSAVGLLLGLSFGGSDCIKHLILRFMLYRSGRMPWNYVGFLDFAVERIFLRRVGGGYIFVHRMLLEFFAALGEGQAGLSQHPGAEFGNGVDALR